MPSYYKWRVCNSWNSSFKQQVCVVAGIPTTLMHDLFQSEVGVDLTLARRSEYLLLVAMELLVAMDR